MLNWVRIQIPLWKIKNRVQGGAQKRGQEDLLRTRVVEKISLEVWNRKASKTIRGESTVASRGRISTCILFRRTVPGRDEIPLMVAHPLGLEKKNRGETGKGRKGPPQTEPAPQLPRGRVERQ